MNIGVYFASMRGTVSMIQSKTFILRLLNGLYGICRSIFGTLEVILLQLDVLWPRYGQKHLFLGIVIGFTTFALLFLEHWCFFCVDLMYG